MKRMKILVGCEESQVVTLECNKLGHFAFSCDLQECSGGRPDLHYKESIFHVLHGPYYSLGLDLFIAHPPCTFLANSGVRWLASKKPKEGYEWNEEHKIYINPKRWEQMVDGAIFFRSLLYTNCERIAIENPIMHKYALKIIGKKPTQIIQPWMFGHGETKATCLWLKGLPRLNATDIVQGREAKIHKMPPGPERSKLRSKTYPGIAKAMAAQWAGPAN